MSKGCFCCVHFCCTVEGSAARHQAVEMGCHTWSTSPLQPHQHRVLSSALIVRVCVCACMLVRLSQHATCSENIFSLKYTTSNTICTSYAWAHLSVSQEWLSCAHARMNIDDGAPDSLASCLGVRHMRISCLTVFHFVTLAAFPSDTRPGFRLDLLPSGWSTDRLFISTNTGLVQVP